MNPWELLEILEFLALPRVIWCHFWNVMSYGHWCLPPPPPCLSYLVPLFARSDLAQPYHATLPTLHIETLRLVPVPLSPMWEKRKINRKYLCSQPSLFAMVNLKIRLFSILIYFHVRVFLEYKGWNAKKNILHQQFLSRRIPHHLSAQLLYTSAGWWETIEVPVGCEIWLSHGLIACRCGWHKLPQHLLL